MFIISHPALVIAQCKAGSTAPFPRQARAAHFSAGRGEDLATRVMEDYQVPAKSTGTIRKITLEAQPTRAADRSTVDKRRHRRACAASGV